MDWSFDGSGDWKSLERDLSASVSGEVRFDAGSRALYSTDGSNYRQVPIGVVVPASIDDVVKTIEACRRHGAPILSRGGGTSLAGQCCNAAVVMDFSKHVRGILAIDPDKRLARVEPGLVLDQLQKEARRHGLFFPPDPATHDRCTLGGMIGNNSCGVHSVMAGRTSDNVEELEVLTYDGERFKVGATAPDELAAIIRAGGAKGRVYEALKRLIAKYETLVRERYPKIPRRVSGYNLPDLLPENGFHVARALVGSESTLVTVLEATVKLTPEPTARSLLVLGYRDVFAAGDHIPQIMAFKPIGLEGLDEALVADCRKKNLHPDAIKLLPAGAGWLLVEFGADTKAEADARAAAAMAALKGSRGAPSMKLFDDKSEEAQVWSVRESGLGATAMVPGEKPTWEGWEDSAVPPEKLGAYLREFKTLLERFEYKGDLYGHFGQGCLHTRINFDLLTKEGIRKYRAFLDEASDLVVKLGGSFSGEHGDGQSRAALLPKMFGRELMEAFHEFKRIWDPQWKMNPGKVIDAFQPDENLRLGVDYRPAQPATHFQFPEDDGSFAHAALRCVGVGKCRSQEGGTMCPSFRVTMEEKHSTRGRAHLLFEMLQGDVIGRKLWRDESVKEALDLCLSCKGCKSDCPVNVDMATYKAEFLSHYYKRRPRPVAAYSMGLIHWWARMAAVAPGAANRLFDGGPLAGALKRLGGIARQRRTPRFASETFAHWFSKRPRRNGGGDRVILWPDTFTNYFHPDIGRSAVEVLEYAGYHVEVPRGGLCCGRPLYDYGMLPLAKRLLAKILAALRREIAAGIPVVVLEPSCAAVFRDELINLFPHDEDAARLSLQTYVLSEFLEKKARRFPIPALARDVLLHGHCHQKAIMGLEHDKTVLERLGTRYEAPDFGCCGMAGSFGFEAGERYEVSMKIGEQALLPAVRKLPESSIIIADGFSCREQIVQATGREPLHLAQVLRAALRASRS